MGSADLKEKLCILVDKIVYTQATLTRKWHKNIDFLVDNADLVIQNVINNHFMNFKLWHIEDVTRNLDISDKHIADCKREIDFLNKQRTEFYEQIDDNFILLLKDFIVNDSSIPFNTESIGSIIDRLSILSLKIYHMNAEKKRRTLAKSKDNDYKMIVDRLNKLNQQQKDLVSAFKNLITEYINGTKRPIVYKQLKMYNDKNLNPELYNQNSNM
ncbi:MAG: DUF4254 domain-containing protein [Alphaproteobacteria bacterium]|nr:DUF4254 domain-containing protein [Alphaproteobacteria bacterium]